MGYFDLPRGEFELNFKPKRNGTFRGEPYKGWKNVMMTDSLYPSDIAECVESWSANYTILGARYNGREVTIPTKYHWELQDKDGNTLETFKTYKEARDAAQNRRWERRNDPSVKIGHVEFVQD